MTDILCKWLNEDVKLQEVITPEAFASQFSSGYLLGEIMHNHGLQGDFKSFSPGTTADAKLNNFRRLEPSLRLLQVPFNSNVVCDVMREKPGSATKLMYQLYIALNRMSQQNLTCHAMEAMKSEQKMRHEKSNAEIYQKRLSQKFPRQIQVDLEEMVKMYNRKRLENLEKALAREAKESQKKQEKVSLIREQQRKATFNDRQALSSKVTRSPIRLKLSPTRSQKTAPSELSASAPQNKIAKDVIHAIDTFESSNASARRTNSVMDMFSNYVKGDDQVYGRKITVDDSRSTILNSAENAEKIAKIRMKLCDEVLARKEREKRRRRVLIEQLAAQDAIQQAKHEELLVTCLMRQSQFERRIANQLLDVRAEKDVIKNNRLRRERQYMERRMKDFDEALDFERKMAQLVEEENKEKLEQEKQVHADMAQKRREEKYRKHYDICQEILLEIVDMSCRVGYYREISEGPIPYQHWTELKSMFVSGVPFYRKPQQKHINGIVQEDSSMVEVLNEANMLQYHEIKGEWSSDNPDIEIHLDGKNNYILGHILKRLCDIVYCPPPPPIPPKFPRFLIKACVLGKTQSGKTSLLKVLGEKLGFKVLDIDELVGAAIAAYKSNETYKASQIVESKTEPPQMAEDGLAFKGEVPPKDEASTKVEAQSKADPPSKGDVSSKSDPAKVTGPAADDSTETANEPSTKTPLDSLENAISPAPSLTTVEVDMPTQRAVLGKEIDAVLAKGKPIPVHLLVTCLTDEIHALPDSSGWVLDNFPRTVRQAKALEKALTGFSGPEGRASSQSISSVQSNRTTPSPLKAPKTKKGKKTNLVSEPATDKAAPTQTPVSGIDVVVHLALSDKEALVRACKYSEGSDDDTQNTEMTTKHKLIPFNEEWHRIESWYGMFNNLVTVNAEQHFAEVSHELENHLKVTLEKKESKEATVTPAEERAETGYVTDATIALETETPVGGEAGVTPVAAASAEGNTETPPQPPTPPPAPGTDNYEYLNEPISLEAASVIYPQWETVEDSYVTTCKVTFQKMREERENIYQYFFRTKKNFRIYLERPDNKQTFVQNWIKMYNDISEDLRGDVDMKCELHQTIDDLKDQLWDISDKKKAAAEEERWAIMHELWLEDHCSLLINNYIQLMQAELDRYQGSLGVIRDYYVVMEKKIPDEMTKEFSRVPLVEIPKSESAGSITQSPSRLERSKSNVSSHNVSDDNDEQGRKIPLIKKKNPRASAGKKESSSDSADQEHEESQIVESYQAALAIVEALKVPSIEDEAARPDAGAKTKAKGKDKKGGKKKGSKNPTPSAISPGPEPTAEDLAKQKLIDKSRLECSAALLFEEKHLNLRLATLKYRALTSIKKLKERASEMYTLQNDWIGMRFNSEMDSINTLCKLLKDLVESEKPILPQLILQDDLFLVDMSHRMLEPPTPPKPDAAIELKKPDQFTIHQIQMLQRNLIEIAPEGFISVELLTELFSSHDGVPDMWFNLTFNQVELILSKHLVDCKYINWNHVILSAMNPFPIPSKSDLLNALQEFRHVDTKGTGRVDMAGFAQAHLWFGNNILEDANSTFYREGHLKVMLFTLFCDSNYELNYFNLLMLFCCDFVPVEGLFKALSLVTGHVIELEEQVLNRNPEQGSRPGSPTGAEADFPTTIINITKEQLLSVVRFGQLETPTLRAMMEELGSIYDGLAAEDESGLVDISQLIINPSSRDILKGVTAYHLVDYRRAVLEQAQAEGKLSDKVLV